MVSWLKHIQDFRPHKTISGHERKTITTWGLTALAIFLVLLYGRRFSGLGTSGGTWRAQVPGTSGSDGESARHFSEVLASALDKFPPLKDNRNPGWPTADAQQDHWSPDEKEPMDNLKSPTKDIIEMRDAHQGFVDTITEKLVEYAPSTSSRSARRGIVTVGGGKYFPPLLVSLRLLRRTGNTLPVEVFLPESEYEEALCEEVLPSLNTQCRKFPKLGSNSIQRFQFKIFAVLLSSFQELLLIDADDIPLVNIAPYFDAQAFKDTGLVTWPDFWHTTVSPLYYLISSQPAMPLSRRPSTESGQMFIDKTKHWKTLLLAAYYNYYGPTYYYPLLCQNAVGCGDKETFLPAAEVFNLSFYEVKTPVESVGHRLSNDGKAGHALLQGDFVQEYVLTQSPEGKPWSEDRKVLYAGIKPMFLHMSPPKWDPAVLLERISQWSTLIVDIDGKPSAAWQYPPEAANKIKGAERMAWEEARWVACNLEGKFKTWKGKTTPCGRLNKHFKDVLDTDKGKDLGLGPEDGLYPALAL
ncbi:putative Alpha-mannosyltransferase [Seiridium cardinale]|uniref:Alpha-mannosyltransferase n=1 Tax=Seiridium cardinale TaxID=138064 RepID=A0ABR2XHL1_9PEZI